jgi:predicted alpha/beta-fold hydrolase
MIVNSFLTSAFLQPSALCHPRRFRIPKVLHALDSPDSFQPLFQNGDWQTVVARFWPSRINLRKYPLETRLFDTEPGVRVVALCHWRQPDPKGTILIAHGLEGSSQSPYVLRMASRALVAGYQVVRLNIRNCGGTEHLGPTLYHSGLTQTCEQWLNS